MLVKSFLKKITIFLQKIFSIPRKASYIANRVFGYMSKKFLVDTYLLPHVECGVEFL